MMDDDSKMGENGMGKEWNFDESLKIRFTGQSGHGVGSTSLAAWFSLR